MSGKVTAIIIIIIIIVIINYLYSAQFFPKSLQWLT